jgi:hypothetical protein
MVCTGQKYLCRFLPSPFYFWDFLCPFLKENTIVSDVETISGKKRRKLKYLSHIKEKALGASIAPTIINTKIGFRVLV